MKHGIKELAIEMKYGGKHEMHYIQVVFIPKKIVSDFGFIFINGGFFE